MSDGFGKFFFQEIILVRYMIKGYVCFSVSNVKSDVPMRRYVDILDDNENRINFPSICGLGERYCLFVFLFFG